jgi:RIP metalloprotease RseP
MNDFLLGVASFALVLIPLVIIHEFGHFIAAKLSGITVLEFGIGFPPRAAILFTKGDTIYSLNWLPIGGFVRPYGEDFVSPKSDDEMSVDRQEIEERGIENPKSVFDANPWQRLFFMAAGPGINFLAALVLFIVVALVGWPFARADVTVYEILPDSIAEQVGLQQGDVILSVGGEEVESAYEFNEMLRDNDQDSVTLLIERDGEQQTITVPLPSATGDYAELEHITVGNVAADSPAAEAGFEPGDIVLTIDGDDATNTAALARYLAAHAGETVVLNVQRDGAIEELRITPGDAPGLSLNGTTIARVYISGIFEDEPADKAGFETEDLIVAVDGWPITQVEQLQEYTDAHKNETVNFTVLRDEQELTLPVVPQESDGKGRIGILIAGVEPAEVGVIPVNRNVEQYTVAMPPGEAIQRGTDEFVEAHRLLGQFVGDLIAGDIAPEAARPVSPIGIGQLGGPVLEQTLERNAAYPIVRFAAMISIALAITNLLPIPGLDGGRILFVIIELIRGKPMEPEREGVFHFIGLLLLLALIAITVINDIVNPIDLNNLR